MEYLSQENALLIRQERMNWLAGFVLALLCLFPVSAFTFYAGVSGILLSFLLGAFYIITTRRVSSAFGIGLSLISVLGVASLFRPLFFWEFTGFAYLIPFFLSLALVFSLIERHIYYFVSMSTKILSLLLVGAAISVVWVGFSGVEIAQFRNPDGRLSYLFPFSLTNSFWDRLIRPSAIYDEPGAFSFFICAIVTMRQLTGFDERKSFFILLLGIVTLSLAHVIYCLIFLFSMRNRVWAFMALIVTALIGLVLVTGMGLTDIFYDVFLVRFKITESGLHGDNRSMQLLSNFYYLAENPVVLIAGHSRDILADSFLYRAMVADGGEVGANPLNLLTRYGIFGSLPYYASIIFFLFSFGIGRVWWCVFGFCLLIFQRDYMFVVSYSFCIVMIFRLIVIRYRDKNSGPDNGCVGRKHIGEAIENLPQHG